MTMRPERCPTGVGRGLPCQAEERPADPSVGRRSACNRRYCRSVVLLLWVTALYRLGSVGECVAASALAMSFGSIPYVGGSSHALELCCPRADSVLSA
jgi:hypothetical protein